MEQTLESRSIRIDSFITLISTAFSKNTPLNQRSILTEHLMLSFELRASILFLDDLGPTIHHGVDLFCRLDVRSCILTERLLND